MRTPRTDIAASVLAQMQPWSCEAVDAKAWRITRERHPWLYCKEKVDG